MLSDCIEEVKIDKRTVNTLTFMRTGLRYLLTGRKWKLIQFDNSWIAILHIVTLIPYGHF
jgi:hypothetical protein